METIDVHSKSFVVKWIQVPDGATLMFQLKPIKRSITFGVYRSAGGGASGEHDSPYSLNGIVESNNSSSTSLHRKRSNSSLSLEERLRNSSLAKVKSYGMLQGNELFQTQLKFQQGGIYAFVFDNTFSKSYSKKVLFNKFFIVESSSNRKMSSASSLSLNPNQLHPNKGQYLQGYLLKKKRKKLQGFTKRYFILNFKYNTLTYYLNENSLKIRGEMQINISSVSAFKDENTIVIDSGMEVWILKTLNNDDWKNWINALDFIKLNSQSSLQQQQETKESVQRQSQPDITISEDDSPSSSPAQFPTTNYVGTPIEKIEEHNISSTDDAHNRKLSVINEKIDNLAKSFKSLEGTMDNTNLSDTKDELENLSSYVRSLLHSSTSDNEKGLILSPQTSIFSDDYYDAHDAFQISNEDAEIDDDNHVVLLQGKKHAETPYSVDEYSDQDEISSIEASPLPEQSPPSPEKLTDLYPLPVDPPVQRRNTVSKATSTPPSLFSFLRKNVGKDLSTISMPVTSNEPLTILQKMSENFEHSYLLNEASLESNNDIKMLKIATFAISNLGSFRSKERNLRKPFNPILGETFEFVDDVNNYRLIGEKVHHKPQIFAFDCEAPNWELSFALNPEQKFWGKSLELINKGVVTLVLKSTGEVFKWQQPTTMLKNIIAGDRYSEPVNTLTITSSIGLKSIIEFKKPASGLFSTPRSEELTIHTMNNSSKSDFYVDGKWTSELYLKNSKNESSAIKIFEASKLLEDEESRWGFSIFASNLNEITSIEEGKIPVTDSRLRPDVQSYEAGDIKSAERLKLEIEQKQREKRAILADKNIVHLPSYFKKIGEDGMIYEVIKGENSYWNKRKKGDWNGVEQLW